MRTEKPEICRDCKYARDKFEGMCYCDKDGLIVGYPKFYCEGYENDGQEVQEQESRA